MGATMDLADLLGLGAREHVAVVGAGGKKTAMQHLTDRGRRRDLSIGYTTTTHMPPPPDIELLVAGRGEIVERLGHSAGSVAFAEKRIADPDRAAEKVRGHEAEVVDDVFETGRFDWLLVKADGARRRDFKAPGRSEPVIPSTTSHVLAFASVTAVGDRLTEETVHRPERVAAIADIDIGDVMTPLTVAAVLASPRGALKGVPDPATVTPVVNKADTPARQETARRIASLVLERTNRVDRVLVTSFKTDFAEPVRS